MVLAGLASQALIQRVELPDLPADRNFNTLDYIEGKLVLCGGDGDGPRGSGLARIARSSPTDSSL